MDSSIPPYRSVFDIIEERSLYPEPFKWTSASPSFSYDSTESLHQGKLFTVGPVGRILKCRRFVLTMNALWRFKAASKVPSKVLKLKNPRVERIEDPTHTLHGFKLVGYKAEHEFYCKDAATLEEWLGKLQKICVLSGFSTKYTFGKQLGKGCFARVHLAVCKSDSSKVAVKTIEKSKILGNYSNMDSAINEISILRMLSHPNIIKLFEVYENELYVHLVLEYLGGGELFQNLKTKGVYSEKDAALAIKCVLEALQHCHELGVLHRDLKPENLILMEGGNRHEVKIVDFGLATVVDPKVLETTKCGSPGYIAPEILSGIGYGTKADIFSTGIILCIILTGVSPFHAMTTQEALAKNREGRVNLAEGHWFNVSPEAKDLVAKMVEMDPSQRLTASEALAHPWFSMDHSDSTVLASAYENMQNHNSSYRFNMEKIKPQFGLVTCSPMFRVRSNDSDSQIVTSADNSPAVGAISKEEDKSGFKAVAKRSLAKRNSKGYKKLSSFHVENEWKKALDWKEENTDYNQADMDEKGVAQSKEEWEKKVQHKPFTPSMFKGRELPRTPGFKPNNSMSYLKSIATPIHKWVIARIDKTKPLQMSKRSVKAFEGNFMGTTICVTEPTGYNEDPPEVIKKD